MTSEPWRLGGGRERVNPPPRRLVWRFWEVWRVWKLRSSSTRLEAEGLGGSDRRSTCVQCSIDVRWILDRCPTGARWMWDRCSIDVP